MKKYQYQVLRYMPDRVSGEFVNLGIVIYDQEAKKFRGQFFEKIGRVSNFFPSINSRHLATTLKFFQKEFEKISQRTKMEFDFERYRDIEQITSNILPKDDSALFFTSPKTILEINEEIAIKDLYRRFVLNYVDESDRDYVNDKEVWNRIYKSYFESCGVTTHLKSHTVKTQLDTWQFDKAWKNGVWNCFETISFDLVKTESIKDKVYKWSGKIDELRTSKEPVHIYLLSKLPEEHAELISFIKKKLGKINYPNNVQVELVPDSNAEKFVRRIKKEIEAHSE